MNNVQIMHIIIIYRYGRPTYLLATHKDYIK